MEFKAREDIEAPLSYVFGQITDFPAFERSIMRRGGDVIALEGPKAPEVGARWDVHFRMRGKERVARATLVDVDPSQGLTIEVSSENIDGKCQVELVPLSRSRTRLNVVVATKPTSLPAKLLFQSMRFGKHRMTQRFKTMVMGYAEDVESRYRAQS